MRVRKIHTGDEKEWVRLRNSLWPDSLQVHLFDVTSFFCGKAIDVVEVLVLERSAGILAGFLELNIRNYAEGSKNSTVPYIEGWYVDEDLRSQGFGKLLMEAAEEWAKENGFNELASDAELENTGSIAAHTALGFEEVERKVCFLKRLK
ncbi:GNAT family N-acetyltransferase [bacterium]|jgi:aminoglycoside 6'-N-acetyltransferase I|nr:GNAT family N-acetyltransferase [bacterium]